MSLAVGDGQECGKQAIVIQADMQFYRALGGAESGPGKDTEAEIDCRGIERIELVPEAEAMAGSTCLALGEEFSGQLFVQRVGLLFVNPGQGRAAHGGDSQVVELGSLGREVADDIAQAGTSR